MVEVRVLSGDIARVEADALVTAINSFGMWFGGVDGVIQRCAGSHFHQQAGRAPLQDGKTVVAYGDKPHKGAFRNVVFVVDDMRQPLRKVVLAGLEAADLAGFKTVTLPTMRMGVMLGLVEKTPQQAVDEMAAAVNAFKGSARSVETITVVVYKDAKVLRWLTDALLP
jgi:O-acetyl-ADP-ribose deacetylase (regulator of RNase III)